jgi:hypothetical protein
MPNDFDSKPRPPTNELTRNDPTVRARRVAMNRPDDGEAFLPDPTRRGAHITAGDAESFGEEFVASATGGEPVQMDANDEVVEEEEGGPFLLLDSEEDAASNEGESIEPRPPARNVRRSLSR